MIDMFEFAIEPEAIEVGLIVTAGSYVDGRWVAANAAPVPIMATIQPMNIQTTGSELKDAPEGVRREAVYMFWSRTDVEEAQIIVYKGKNYRVLQTWDWQDQGGYTKAALGLAK